MITRDEIQELLHSTETYRVERTTSTGDMDKFQEAICAFANDLPNSKKKGYLIIGANDDGSLSGLNVTDDLLKMIAGEHVFNVADGHLIATFDRDVKETTVTEIVKQHPNYFVIRDASAANVNVLDSYEQIFRHYSPDTICKIL